MSIVPSPRRQDGGPKWDGLRVCQNGYAHERVVQSFALSGIRYPSAAAAIESKIELCSCSAKPGS